jgi:hypothetical protein
MQVRSQVHREGTDLVERIGERPVEGKRLLEQKEVQQLVVRRKLEQRVVSINILAMCKTERRGRVGLR